MKIYAKVEGSAYEFDRPDIDSRGFHQGSWAKFCPLCLTGWAHFTAVKLDSAGRPSLDGYHCVRGQMCIRCGKQVKQTWGAQIVPGSLLEEPHTNCQSLDWDLLYYLPRPLLLREFYLHDKFFNHQDQPHGNTQQSSESWKYPSTSGNAYDACDVRPERL